ncbi:hypothetical protein SAMN04487782_1553 [Stenotrophomonas maltophilia]|nr:hypothetical protein SAMN04487782_1553 [Stenotrophomonas maltophilia]
MDCSIVLVAPERARSAEIRPALSAVLASSRIVRACHSWLSANDDLNTYRGCLALFAAALALEFWERANG